MGLYPDAEFLEALRIRLGDSQHAWRTVRFHELRPDRKDELLTGDALLEALGKEERRVQPLYRCDGCLSNKRYHLSDLFQASSVETGTPYTLCHSCNAKRLMIHWPHHFSHIPLFTMAEKVEQVTCPECLSGIRMQQDHEERVQQQEEQQERAARLRAIRKAAAKAKLKPKMERRLELQKMDRLDLAKFALKLHKESDIDHETDWWKEKLHSYLQNLHKGTTPTEPFHGTRPIIERVLKVEASLSRILKVEFHCRACGEEVRTRTLSSEYDEIHLLRHSIARHFICMKCARSALNLESAGPILMVLIDKAIEEGALSIKADYPKKE